ncbi:hypothetical protein RUND412_009151, partial [Rhizina undulata]
MDSCNQSIQVNNNPDPTTPKKPKAGNAGKRKKATSNADSHQSRIYNDEEPSSITLQSPPPSSPNGVKRQPVKRRKKSVMTSTTPQTPPNSSPKIPVQGKGNNWSVGTVNPNRDFVRKECLSTLEAFRYSGGRASGASKSKEPRRPEPQTGISYSDSRGIYDGKHDEMDQNGGGTRIRDIRDAAEESDSPGITDEEMIALLAQANVDSNPFPKFTSGKDVFRQDGNREPADSTDGGVLTEEFDEFPLDMDEEELFSAFTETDGALSGNHSGFETKKGDSGPRKGARGSPAGPPKTDYLLNRDVEEDTYGTDDEELFLLAAEQFEEGLATQRLAGASGEMSGFCEEEPKLPTKPTQAINYQFSPESTSFIPLDTETEKESSPRIDMVDMSSEFYSEDLLFSPGAFTGGSDTIINERFSPPASLNYALNDDSQDQDIFDHNLCGSPLGTQFNVETQILDCDWPKEEDPLFIPDWNELLGNSSDSEETIPHEHPSPNATNAFPEESTAPEPIGNLPAKRKANPKPKPPPKKIKPGPAAKVESKKRKLRIRIIDDSQLKISRFMTPHKKLVPGKTDSDGAEKAGGMNDENGNMKPFVRPPFPELAKERSLVDGLCLRTIVRPCFRVGEALRVAWMGVNNNASGRDVLVELYARVTYSERVEVRQYFQFGDIFHDRPPFLSGTYERFKSADLWEKDSAVFLGAEGKGKIARVVGKMRKKGGSGEVGFMMHILSIWESDWEEVEE